MTDSKRQLHSCTNPPAAATPLMSPCGVGTRVTVAGSVVFFLALVFVMTSSHTPVLAEVFHSKESALRLAFPDADTVDKREIFLSSEQVEEVERLARVQVPSRLVTVYIGRKSGSPLGYAFIETHQVRTLPETILIVLEPDGRVRDIYMLAFHEPPEYGPPDRWLGQFQGRLLDDDLSLRGEVAGIAGATLTATAITAALRKTLATLQVALLRAKEESGDPGDISDSGSEDEPRKSGAK
ncbi:MAG: FMN-binding protein [Candidatus Latescibacterota bacterium]|nr:MAG: FMN-binding protein [Candidatus Latescibacterota bacterium]